MGLCSLCETTCAILVLCAPFAPKAFISARETKAYTGIKKYMTLRTNTTNATGTQRSSHFHELKDVPRGGKPKDPWDTDHSPILSPHNDRVYNNDRRSHGSAV